ncbi:MAG: 2-oxo acid dehydrogenase subunit E2 [Clostridia bacterium]|nr:2-oxo acid dehydrogenase subunit E2 [Clostridia bacterium]
MQRKEGRRIKSGPPMDAVAAFIMPNRNGSSNQFSATVNIKKCEELIQKKRAEGLKSFGMIHIFMAAYTRMLSELPGINRFIRGQRLYARNGIEICMAIKKELSLNAPETVIKVYADPTDTVIDIYEKLTKELTENKQEGDHNAMDAAVKVLVSLPGILLKFTVWFLKLLDYFGLLPRFLTKLSPFHGTLFITNMGSLGMPPIHHHLYDFGNLPVFIAMGKKRTEYSISPEGKTVTNRVIDFTVVCDERICDGHYYARGFKKLKRLLEDPVSLLTPPESVTEDIK